MSNQNDLSWLVWRRLARARMFSVAAPAYWRRSTVATVSDQCPSIGSERTPMSTLDPRPLRTAATAMTSNGVPRLIAGRILNHADAGLNGVLRSGGG
jgi:hypothetical protein